MWTMVIILTTLHGASVSSIPGFDSMFACSNAAARMRTDFNPSSGPAPLTVYCVKMSQN